MFKLSEIRDLIKLLDQTAIQSIEIENENGKLVIKKPDKQEPTIVAAPALTVAQSPVLPVQTVLPQVAPTTAVTPLVATHSQPATPSVPAETSVSPLDDPTMHKIVSPMVGTFYRKPSPDQPPYVDVGTRVTNDKVVCIVEAMKLMNEIIAEVNGVIAEVLVEDGQLIEFGQPLFLVKPGS